MVSSPLSGAACGWTCLFGHDLELLQDRVIDRVGAENPVTSCDLHVFVDEAAESVSSKDADGRPGAWRGAACGRSLIQ